MRSTTLGRFLPSHRCENVDSSCPWLINLPSLFPENEAHSDRCRWSGSSGYHCRCHSGALLAQRYSVGLWHRAGHQLYRTQRYCLPGCVETSAVVNQLDSELVSSTYALSDGAPLLETGSLPYECFESEAKQSWTLEEFLLQWPQLGTRIEIQEMEVLLARITGHSARPRHSSGWFYPLLSMFYAEPTLAPSSTCNTQSVDTTNCSVCFSRPISPACHSNKQCAVEQVSQASSSTTAVLNVGILDHMEVLVVRQAVRCRRH